MIIDSFRVGPRLTENLSTLVEAIVVAIDMHASLEGRHPHRRPGDRRVCRRTARAPAGPARGSRRRDGAPADRGAGRRASTVPSGSGDGIRRGRCAASRVYALATGSRIVDAYRSAGGAASDADPIAIDLAALVHDGEEIVVPRRGERLASSASDSRIADVSEEASPPAARRRRKQGRKHRRKHVAPVAADDSTTATAEAQSVVDVNAASAAELETLPGIGPALADRIVRFRELNGRFASSNELADVAGMTSGKLDAIAPYARY